MQIWLTIPLLLLFLLMYDLVILSYRRYGTCYRALQPLRIRYSRRLGCTAIPPESFWRLRRITLLLFFSGVILLPASLRMGALLFLILISPETWLALTYSLGAKDRQKEIRFLKRLFILNGSVEPTCFSDVLQILERHAFYLAGTLGLIRRERERNSADMLKVYQSIEEEVGDLELRLFLEKISQADRIHFREGVRSMQTDLNISKLIRRREARKRREKIELTGIVCGVTLAGFLTYAMLRPWLSGSAGLMPP